MVWTFPAKVSRKSGNCWKLRKFRKKSQMERYLPVINFWKPSKVVSLSIFQKFRKCRSIRHWKLLEVQSFHRMESESAFPLVNKRHSVAGHSDWALQLTPPDYQHHANGSLREQPSFFAPEWREKVGCSRRLCKRQQNSQLWFCRGNTARYFHKIASIIPATSESLKILELTEDGV